MITKHIVGVQTVSNWRVHSRYGEELVYATLEGLTDTLHPTFGGKETFREMRRLAQQGDVYLFQRRVPGGYEYVAVRRERPLTDEKIARRLQRRMERLNGLY